MVTVKLLGGLGNQLFQFAYGLALKAKGYEVQFDKDALIERTHREYSLDGFDVRLGDEGGPRITEQSLKFNSEYLRPKDSATMVGYWQTEKYFEDIAPQVRQSIETGLRSKLNRPTSEFYILREAITRYESIGVHVRRQDYVNLQAFHGMPTLDWYRAALRHINVNTLCFKTFVFSDDPEWCYDNFPKDFTIVRGTSKYEDMTLMAACKHVVIANSSFGWWGAWLQNNRNNIVIAPKQWFTDSSVDSSTICPDRWVRL